MVCELLWLSAILAAPGDAWARYDAAQSHMGTKFEIVVYTSGDELAQEAFQAGFERIAELNLVMSDYVSESELSRLSNSSPTTSPVKVSVTSTSAPK